MEQVKYFDSSSLLNYCSKLWTSFGCNFFFVHFSETWGTCDTYISWWS